MADIAILVIDVTKGFEAQTHESLSILRGRKTPFLVAANKIDAIPGWVQYPDVPFAASYHKQDPAIRRELEELLYVIIGTFSRLGINADRFDNVTDFTKTVAIIPVSAKTGEGIPELIAILIGLTQQYMQQKLLVSQGPGKGTVLEVKEEPGLGLTLNVILYEGTIEKGETIVTGGKEGTSGSGLLSTLLTLLVAERAGLAPSCQVNSLDGEAVATAVPCGNNGHP